MANDDGAPPPAPFKVTLADPLKIRPARVQGIAVAPLHLLQKSGISLAWGVLACIAGLALVLTVLVGIAEFGRPAEEVAIITGLVNSASARYLAAGDPATLQQANDLLTHLAEAKRSSRDFWTGFSQFLLLNLLLPVLTLILGYVFGTMKNDSARGNSSQE